MLTEKNEKKKGLTINVTMGQTITIFILICIAFAGGFMLNQKELTVTNEYNGFTEQDKNMLGNLAYASGECERQGLASDCDNTLLTTEGDTYYCVKSKCTTQPDTSTIETALDNAIGKTK